METHKLSVRDNLLKLATRIDLIAEEADIIKDMPELISKEELVKELLLLNTLLEEFYVEYNKLLQTTLGGILNDEDIIAVTDEDPSKLEKFDLV